MKALLFLALGFNVMPAFAAVSGGSSSGGGFVIKCGTQIQLFDYYLAEQAGLHLSPVPGNTFSEKALALLKRLESIDPNRAKNYRYQFNHWWGFQSVVPMDALHLNSDQAADPNLQKEFGLGKVQIPKGCELILAIQQMAPERQEWTDHTDFKLVTQRFGPVWDSLDPDTQAGLVAHELFYEELLLTKNAQSAEFVRTLNGKLGTHEFSKTNEKQWQAELTKNHYIPMFSDFNVGFDEVDLNFDTDSGPSNDYQFHQVYALNPVGDISVCNQTINVQSEGINKPGDKQPTYFYYDGLVPEYSTPKQGSVWDLSCFSTSGLLKVNIGSNCITKMSRRTNAFGQSSVDIDFLGAAPTVSQCSSYLDTYANQKLKTLGMLYAGAHWNDQLKSMVLNLVKTDFSDIQVLINGTWERANQCVAFNLSTGELLEKDGAPNPSSPSGCSKY